VTKTSDNDYNGAERSLFGNALNKRTNQMVHSHGKNNQNGKNGIIDHLSTTVTTANHNTVLGWNDGNSSSRRAMHCSQIKVIDNSEYKYENKFFPRRSIAGKLKYVQIGQKKKQIINLGRFPNCTDSVPSRKSSKMVSSSFKKATPVFLP
jgi:hypothetical protein